MKKTIRNKFIVGLLALTVLLTTVPSQVFAVSGSVYFYPVGDVETGTQFTVEIRGNVPGPGWGRGGGATIRVAYDASKLELIERNDSGGAFRPNNGQNWDGSSAGLLRYEARIFWGAPGVNNTKIFSATFKATAPGATTLSFASANVNDGPTTGTASSFTIRNPVCPTGQVGTPPNCSTPPKPTPKPSVTPKPSSTPRPPTTPRPSATPTPTPVPTTPPETVEETPEPESSSQGGLKIENVRITANRQTNSVSWTVNQAEDVQPTLTYGQTRSAQKTEAKVVRQEDGSYIAEMPSLKIGSLYYFTIKVASTDQLSGASQSGTLTTRGYPVQLTIKQNGILAAGAKVRIGDRSFTANKNAIITTELGDGTHIASITPAGATEALQVSFAVQKKTIPATGNPELQAFELNATVNGSSGANDQTALMTVIGSILATLLGLGGLIGFLLYRRRQQNEEANTNAIDVDALAAYGPSIQETRDMTPEPNLQASGALTSTFTDTPEQVSDPAFVAANDPYAVDLQPPLEATYQSELPPVADSLPLPPENDPYSQVDTYASQQLPPVVESAGIPEPTQQPYEPMPEVPVPTPSETTEPVTEEPSAVFDAATGELEILHKHSPSLPSPVPTAQQGGSQ